MQRSSRVDYDAIAELYDSTPHREKSADPELLAGGPTETLTLLDIACGTGNQQIANRGLAPNARFVGLDGSLGMRRQARRKMPDIAWGARRQRGVAVCLGKLRLRQLPVRLPPFPR
jgi:ubiquinone/menaquinone biosynthesis C-methylase UbiE